MLDLVLLPNEKLHCESQPVQNITQEIVEYCKKMIETTHYHQGIGLAAVQTGRMENIFVSCIEEDEDRVFINPQILEISIEKSTHHEGCLSIPGVTADVIRPAFVQVKAINLEGNEFVIDADGLLARVIQHEYDHLQGKLFYEYLRPGHIRRLLKAYNNASATVHTTTVQ